VVLWHPNFPTEQIFVWEQGYHFNYWKLYVIKYFHSTEISLRLEAKIVIETCKRITYSILLPVTTACPTCKLPYKQNASIN